LNSNHNTLQITLLQQVDINLLQQIATQTFIETFAHVNTEEDMQLYIQNNLSLDQLQQEWDNENSLFYIATLNGSTIGYIKLNQHQAQTVMQGAEAIEIERIYILQAYQGLQYGSLLLHQVITTAHQLNKKFIWLGVWEQNKRAIQFYKKQGFQYFDQHIFMLGNDAQTDWLMKKDLSPLNTTVSL
jgi:ribosomal protein S18 acetylase RimI-like enzyme